MFKSVDHINRLKVSPLHSNAFGANIVETHMTLQIRWHMTKHIYIHIVVRRPLIIIQIGLIKSERETSNLKSYSNNIII